MFSNILIAVDGSEPSNKALEYGMTLAEKFNGRITLIHVYSSVIPMTASMDTLTTPPTMSPHSSPAIAAQIAEETKQRGQHILDEAEQTVKKRGFTVEKVLREGDAVREIVTMVQDKKFDLVVVGHRGWGRLREIVLGGVSEGVSHKSPCPVLIVK